MTSARPSNRIRPVRSVKLALGLLVLALGAEPARATFPGMNGRMAYSGANSTIYLSDTGLLVSHGSFFEWDFSSTFSPDGTEVAFIRQAGIGGNQYTYRVMVINTDGTGQHTVADSEWWGVRTGRFIHSLSWTADGTRVSFILQGDASQRGVWTVKAGVGGGGLTRTIAFPQSIAVEGLHWSAVGRQLVYPCIFRSNQYGTMLDLCVFDDLTGATRPLPIDWPGRKWVEAANWTSDGEKIVFLLYYTTEDQGVRVERSDVFSIDAGGGGIKKLSDSGDPVCPHTTVTPGELVGSPSFEYRNPTPSPSGGKIIVYAWRQVPNPDCRNTTGGTYTTPTESGLYLLGGNSGPGTLLQGSTGGSYNDWAPIPVQLMVHIDDGHGHPLKGLKVELKRDLAVYVPTDDGGSYAFETLPAGDYVLRATLTDNRGAGQPPAFQIHHDVADAEPVWIERSIHVPVGARVEVQLSFEESPTITASNVPPEFRERLDDMAAIYWRVRQFVGWVQTALTPDTGQTVKFLTFATVYAGDPVDPDTAFYVGGGGPEIVFGTSFSLFEVRDGEGILVDEAPENGEWHEFTHHLHYTHVFSGDCSGSNHGGYENEDTCDSLSEGLAVFLPAIASHDIEGTSDSWYGDLYDLDHQLKSWSKRVGFGTYVSEESDAVASLLWDLVDADVDSEATEIVGADTVHHATTYTDTQALTLGEVWNTLTTSHPENVRELRTALGTPEVTVDLDADLVPDVAPLDELFLMHGFFPVDVEQGLAGHRAYHYDVAAAQRDFPGLPRNDDVGFSDHRIVDADGVVLDAFIPRVKRPRLPGANLAFDVLDASGTPLLGATVELTVQHPGVPLPQTVSMKLDTGTGALVPLELPSYFDTLLPVGAGLPPCDPATDVQVVVGVRTIVNGYVSTDTASFDNCAYQHAVAAATGPAAMQLTAHFPEDGTAPTSAAVTTPTDTLVAGGGTLGSWIVHLACADPAVGGFASGCWRSEYRIDGGALLPYARSLTISDVGPHVLEFRSADGAGNEEAWRSVALDVAPAPDSDGDGLSDPLEAQLGTNPNDADTDNDGLDDGDEVEGGTNPLLADSDGDGLSDGAEVGLGTNPLTADTDADGLSDGAEVAAGLDPRDPDGDDDGALDGADTCRSLYNRLQRDTDGDGRGDLCDDCPDTANANQSDVDGDGAGDVCDCSPSSPSQRAPASPSVLASKSGASIVLSWAPVAGADDYAVTHGTLADLAASNFGSCFTHTGATLSFSDPQVPASGALFVYLVQGQSFSCGMGSLGVGANETRRTNLGAGACAPAVVVDRQTVSETAVAGPFSGTHLDTHTSNGAGETIYEQLSGGNPSNRYSFLEHRFVINVAAGQMIQLLVEGERAETVEGDDMRFEWSTNGTTFTPVSMDSLPFVPDGAARVGTLPATLSGPVTIRVVDTNRTPGFQDIDWLWIDWLVVRSITF